MYVALRLFVVTVGEDLVTALTVAQCESSCYAAPLTMIMTRHWGCFMAATEGMIPFRGYRTWYRIVGDGEEPGKLPLLALHGGPGVPHDYLESMEALADTGRRVPSALQRADRHALQPPAVPDRPGAARGPVAPTLQAEPQSPRGDVPRAGLRLLP